ncbi:MAG: hypothetical protein ACXVX9_05235 [Mycobacteriaceae bacterium]
MSIDWWVLRAAARKAMSHAHTPPINTPSVPRYWWAACGAHLLQHTR